jgi:hypothetical protein
VFCPSFNPGIQHIYILSSEGFIYGLLYFVQFRALPYVLNVYCTKEEQSIMSQNETVCHKFGRNFEDVTNKKNYSIIFAKWRNESCLSKSIVSVVIAVVKILSVVKEKDWLLTHSVNRMKQERCCYLNSEGVILKVHKNDNFWAPILKFVLS